MYSTILPDSIKITITTDPSEVNERKDMVYFQEDTLFADNWI
jgi:hypothetical protein